MTETLDLSAKDHAIRNHEDQVFAIRNNGRQQVRGHRIALLPPCMPL
jgi:hypothetical protein